MIVVTWLNTKKGLYGLWTSSNTSFTELVLREGIIYFGYVMLRLHALFGVEFTCVPSVLLSLNVMQICVSFYKSTISSLIPAFADPYVARPN